MDLDSPMMVLLTYFFALCLAYLILLMIRSTESPESRRIRVVAQYEERMREFHQTEGVVKVKLPPIPPPRPTAPAEQQPMYQQEGRK